MAVLTFGGGGLGLAQAPAVPDIAPPPTPVVLPDDFMTPFDAQVNAFHGLPATREKYGVSGKGLTVAVIDTGLNIYHRDFQGKILKVHNFTSDDVDDVTDEDGHGSNVTSIIAANEKNPDGTKKGLHFGAAPGASIVALKVFPNNTPGVSLTSKALKWVLDNHAEYGISVVNLSSGVETGFWSNLKSDAQAANIECRLHIQALRAKNIPVVVSSGNSYFSNGSLQGMAFPAICRETISVGAVYGVNLKVHEFYKDGAVSKRAVLGRCTAFTQRLSAASGAECRTDIFAAGFQVSGASKVFFKPGTTEIDQDASSIGSATLGGTSQSAPFISGLILLLQERYRKVHNNTMELPSVDLLEQVLRDGGVETTDEEDAIAQEMDNVISCGEKFRYAHAAGAFQVLDDPDAKVTAKPPQLTPNALKLLVQTQTFKAEVASTIREEGPPVFPDFKPNVRFFPATVAQKKALVSGIFTAAKESFSPISSVVLPESSFKPDMIEVRFLRYPEDQPVAAAMVQLIKEKFNVTNVRTSFTIRSDPPEKPGDIEVWFPREIKQK